jgi:hypothetical protein
MERKVIDSFTVGGTKAGPSMPGARLQQMLGTRIVIDMSSRTLYVPTMKGVVQASTGDRIILYDDDMLEVEHGQ